MLDLRHRIAVAVLLRRVERQPAVRGRVDVDIRAQPHRAAPRPRPPVGEQLLPHQQRAVRRAQPRIASRRALPDARVVPDERPVRRAAEVLARDQAVGHVLPGERLIVDVRRGLHEAVAVHVPADEPRAVRQPVRKARLRRQQQQMRAPAVPGRDDERLRAVFDRPRRADPDARPARRRSSAASRRGPAAGPACDRGARSSSAPSADGRCSPANSVRPTGRPRRTCRTRSSRRGRRTA